MKVRLSLMDKEGNQIAYSKTIEWPFPTLPQKGDTLEIPNTENVNALKIIIPYIPDDYRRDKETMVTDEIWIFKRNCFVCTYADGDEYTTDVELENYLELEFWKEEDSYYEY